MVFYLGMLANLANGSADMIAALLTFSPLRADFIDYLPVMSSDIAAIYIRSQKSEGFNFATMLSAFTPSLWLAVIFCNFVIGLWLYVTNSKSVPESFGSNKVLWNHIFSMMGYMWAAFTVNFGGKPKDLPKKIQTHDRIGVTTCLLAGSVIWISYRASMTSELSVTKIKHPFIDLETLLETDYK